MTAATLHDILTTLCSEVKLLKKNEAQVSYSLNTAKEAQLAYDVLAAYGFDVHVYHEDAVSKFYINHPSAGPAAEENFAAALSHARKLRNVMNAVEGDAGSEDYHISFTNNLDAGKQISIHFPTRKYAGQPSLSASASQMQHRRPSPSLSHPHAATARSRHDIVFKKHKKSAFMAAGPTVAKKSAFVSRGLRGWLHNYFVSHFAESFLAFCAMIFLAIFVLSIIVTSKGYLCPDIAVEDRKMNRAWYCDVGFSR